MVVWWKIPNLLMTNKQLLQAGLLGNAPKQLRLWI